MEETLGKRIVSNRKRLGLTQDQLAEQLGVTAQAVSKWENDQSCPDISILPRLADIFNITTDVLLGRAPQETVREAEIISEDPTPVTSLPHGKAPIGIALWILLVGGGLLAGYFLNWKVTLWELVWPTGLLVFGIFGLYPRFSFFRLGCALLGTFYLLSSLNAAPFAMSNELLLAAFLLLFGLSLLMDSLLKRKDYGFPRGHIVSLVGSEEQVNRCAIGENRFSCAMTFGEERHNIQLPQLSGGDATVAFGNLTMDLTFCGEISSNAPVTVSCAFGTLELRVPRWCRVDLTSHRAFGVVELKGEPDSVPRTSISLDARVSFGEIRIRYI